jgi:hypothetical protein
VLLAATNPYLWLEQGFFCRMLALILWTVFLLHFYLVFFSQKFAPGKTSDKQNQLFLYFQTIEAFLLF